MRSHFDFSDFARTELTLSRVSHISVENSEACWSLFIILFLTESTIGKETAGLPEKLLFENADKCVRIPMIDEARSLNLSNAVAIGVYETLRQWDYPQLLESGELRNYNWADQQ